MRFKRTNHPLLSTSCKRRTCNSRILTENRTNYTPKISSAIVPNKDNNGIIKYPNVP